MNMPNTRAVALMLSAGYGADALRHYEFYVFGIFASGDPKGRRHRDSAIFFRNSSSEADERANTLVYAY